jgi:hypothetical protein
MQAELSKLSPALPRHLHRAMLMLLRPAEAAARRLIIAAARGLVVELPPRSPGIAMQPADFASAAEAKPAATTHAARPRAKNLPLLDPLKNPSRVRDRHMPAHAIPRIPSLGDDWPYRSLPPSRDDPIDAARLSLRLQALAAALDDLPAQAERFARWKARNDAARARVKEGREPWRPRRLSPLKRGPPPAGRLPHFDPDAPRRKNIREVGETLAHASAMAHYALEPPRQDTS